MPVRAGIVVTGTEVLSATIADRNGSPQLVLMGDGARQLTKEVTRRKAYTSALLGISTSSIDAQLTAASKGLDGLTPLAPVPVSAPESTGAGPASSVEVASGSVPPSGRGFKQILNVGAAASPVVVSPASN